MIVLASKKKKKKKGRIPDILALFQPRKRSRAEISEVDKEGVRQYNQQKAENIRSGKWVFPSRDLANQWGKEHGLNSLQRDFIASGKSPEGARSIFFNMKGFNP